MEDKKYFRPLGDCQLSDAMSQNLAAILAQTAAILGNHRREVNHG